MKQEKLIEKANIILFWVTGITFLASLSMVIFSLIKGDSQTASNLSIVAILMGLMNKSVRQK